MTKENLFDTLHPNILDNVNLREPQVLGFQELMKLSEASEREVGLILPVGCGKTGLITLTPFAFKAKRALVIAPFVKLADQLLGNFHPPHSDFFYKKRHVLTDAPYPEPMLIRGKASNIAILKDADVVVTNIQQLQRENNKWLEKLPSDFFDLIIFDEGHHNTADSWDTLRQKFPTARIINYTATPLRADGQLMTGKIIFSYPIVKAIQNGYIKRLKAVRLSPDSLKYIREEDGREVMVNLEEVIRLGEEDSSFRRSIVSSKETLDTIVEASLAELLKLREATGEKRLKIIASALNFTHCAQIVSAYRARGYSAAYVHSKEDSAANDKVFQQLENHELDVIVQVRKLGEGFDHPYLSVAAVFSIFANLSPFVQFVGRIMRSIDSNNPNSPLNQGTVVFHAGANVARQWRDFQAFTEADQKFFDELMPMVDMPPGSMTESDPNVDAICRTVRKIEVIEQGKVLLDEIPLVYVDDDVRMAFELLLSKGVTDITPEEYRQSVLERVPTTKWDEWKAKKAEIEQLVQTAVGRLLSIHSINAAGKSLSKGVRGQNNQQFLLATVNSKLNEAVGSKSGQRSEWDMDMVNSALASLESVVKEVEEIYCNGAAEEIS